MPKRKYNDTSSVRSKMQTEERRYQMLELYKAGSTERQIAAHMSIDKAYVHRQLKKAMNDLAERHVGTADQIRGLQMERYTTLLARWWPIALTGDEAATNTVLKIMHRISEINGVIPQEPLITIDQRSINLHQGDVTFSIEAASGNDNTDDNIQAAPALS